MFNLLKIINQPLSARESPLTKKLWGMRIRWGEHTFHLNPWINLMGKMNKFRAMHRFADIFAQPAFEPRLLWRAMRH
jgi:hypothetical protein